MSLKSKLLATAVCAALLGMAAPNHASAYTMTVQTANTNGVAFDAVSGGLGGRGISASFNYTGPLNFLVGPPQNVSSSGDLNSTFFANGSISNYVGSGTLPGPANANFTSLSSFLASSGSASNLQYGSLYSIDLGQLAAGTTLTVTHDDGASLFQNNARIDGGAFTAGPTSAITESFTLANSGDTILWYARENGAPSVLNVAVPEPVSIALLGSSLVGLGMIRRKRS